MMTSSNGNIFRVSGPLCGEFTGDRWIPFTKTSDAELWCFRLMTSSCNDHFLQVFYRAMTINATAYIATNNTMQKWPWWRHQIEIFFALLALCEGNPPVTGGFPSQRPVTRSLFLYLVCTRTNGLANNRDAGDLRRHRAHYDIIVMAIRVVAWWSFLRIWYRYPPILVKSIMKVSLKYVRSSVI